MRILLVSHTYLAPINWAKPQALAQTMAAAALTVLTPQRWRDTLFTITAQTTPPPAFLRPLPVLFSGHALRHAYWPHQLIALLRALRPTLVHVEEEPPSLVLTQFALLQRWFGYQLSCFTWENLRVPLGLALALENFNLRHCAGVVAGNTEAAQLLRARGFTQPIQIIPQLGVDPVEFAPSVARAQTPTIGFFGRLVPEKGVWVLLQAFLALGQTHPETRLLLIGSGPLEPAIRAWVQQHDQAHRIQLQAAVPHHAIPQKLHELSILVLPSLTTPNWKEQFGHILIEAMAAGVPVVGSNSGAIPDVIGEAGAVVPEGEVAALQQALTRLIQDAAYHAQCKAAGRARVLAHYTHPHIAGAMLAFFKQMTATIA